MSEFSRNIFFVITANDLLVYTGTERQCNVYLQQALDKGSEPGFLRIVSELPDQEVTGND